MNQPLATSVARHRLVPVIVFAVIALFAVASTGCGKPTIEGAIASYKKAKDNLDASLAKVSPVTKLDVRKKIKEFQDEYKKAEALEGEASMKAIYALSRRMKEYRDKIDPSAKKGSKATAGKGKLDNTKTTATPVKPAQPSSKLNSGSKIQPKPQPKPGPAAQPGQPAGGSGFKPGAVPAPGTNPPPKGGSGFGGK